jgi:hypothetical protein
MNIMLTPSQMPALIVAPPAGQRRVRHRRMHGERARGTSRRTSTFAEVIASCCPARRLNTAIGMRVRRNRAESP